MKFKHIAFIVIISLASTSCSLLENDSQEFPIAGEWEWIRSSGGFAGRTISPDSPGYSEQQLNFYDFSYEFHHIFTLYRADTLAISGTYSLTRQNGSLMVDYKPDGDAFMPDQTVMFNGPDTLILNDRCNDCYTDIYACR